MSDMLAHWLTEKEKGKGFRCGREGTQNTPVKLGFKILKVDSPFRILQCVAVAYKKKLSAVCLDLAENARENDGSFTIEIQWQQQCSGRGKN